MRNSKGVVVPLVDYGVTFNEVPEKTAVFLCLGDCERQCPGCHSPELCTPMEYGVSIPEVEALVEEQLQLGANAIVVLGGDCCYHFDLNDLHELLRVLSSHAPVCLYSGEDDAWIKTFAYTAGCTWIKMGSYMEDKGGLESITTNQRFYRISHAQRLDYRERNFSVIPEFIDETELFWRKGGDEHRKFEEKAGLHSLV